MKKIYHLSTCNTNQRIIKELGDTSEFEFQDIKQKNIGARELNRLARKMGSYEALFSRRSMKFRSMGLAGKQLSEDDYKKLILDEYTFLKRPVIIVEDDVYVGNAKAVVSAAIERVKQG